jgi:HEPN domain-containing protein
VSAQEQKRRRIASFLSIAKEELAAAEILFDKLPRQAAYFQHQTVEKLLRAVLEREGVAVGPTHNIRALTDLLPTPHLLKESFLEFDNLSSAATRFRYPTASGAIASQSAEEVFQRQGELRKLMDAVSAFLAEPEKS